MNRTISITIAGLVFNINEDGYERLKQYLDSVQQHFKSVPYGAEVCADIETRIAEQFTKKLQETKTQVINREDIDALIKTMGTVEDFGPVETKTEETQTTRRLYRNPDDVMVAGVASGIAAYFGWDTNIVRVLFALSVFLGGWGIFIYIFLWIVMPEAKSAAEKLEMRGSPVTLSRLEKTVKEKLDGKGEIAKQSMSKLGNFFRQIFQLTTKIIKVLFSVGVRIGGAVMTTAGILTLLVTTFFLVIFLFNPQSPYVDPAIYEIFNGFKYFLILASAYLLIGVPAAILALLGIMFARFKFRDSFKPRVLGTLAGLWVIGALTFSALTVQAMPRIEERINAPVSPSATEVLDLKDFKTIQISGNFEANVTKGDEFKVVAIGPETSLGEMRTQIEDGTLYISRNERFRICFFCENEGIKLEIAMPELSAIHASSSAEINAQGFTTDKFQAILSSSARAELNITAKEVEVRASSSARAVLAGSTDDMIAVTSSGARVTNNMQIKGNLSVVSSSSSRFVSPVVLVLKGISLQGSSSGRIEAVAEATKIEVTLSSSALATLAGKSADLTAELSSGSRLEAFDLEAQMVSVKASSSARAHVHAVKQLKGEATSGSRVMYKGDPVTDIEENSGSRVDQVE